MLAVLVSPSMVFMSSVFGGRDWIAYAIQMPAACVRDARPCCPLLPITLFRNLLAGFAWCPRTCSCVCRLFHLDGGSAPDETSPAMKTVMYSAKCVLRLMLAVMCVVVSAAAGQFGKATYYKAGQRPYEVITADFNNDGNADLAFADWLSSQLVILLGNGDGTFQKPRFSSLNAAGDLVSGDFNEDGNLDLAVLQFTAGHGTLTLLFGDGKGGFRKGPSYGVGAYPGLMTAADLNGDGHVDVVVADHGPSHGKGDVRVFLGTGKGTLKASGVYKLGGTPVGVAAGDLNGDHFPDLAVTQGLNGAVAVFMNDGTGHFGQPAIYSTGELIGDVGVKIADLRNDGKEDLVIAAQSQGLVVLLNNGNGTFGNYQVYQPNFGGWQPPVACAIADFNLDGIFDVACTPQIDDAYVFYGNGDGTFQPGVQINDAIKNQGGFSIASGDFNNDGAPDLAIPIQDYGKIAIMLNTK